MAEKYTEAQKRASYKYASDKVKIQILVSEERREKWRLEAAKKGMSLTKYIIERMEGDGE